LIAESGLATQAHLIVAVLRVHLATRASKSESIIDNMKRMNEKISNNDRNNKKMIISPHEVMTGSEQIANRSFLQLED
jgi:hypothetical protein